MHAITAPIKPWILILVLNVLFKPDEEEGPESDDEEEEDDNDVRL